MKICWFIQDAQVRKQKVMMTSHCVDHIVLTTYLRPCSKIMIMQHLFV